MVECLSSNHKALGSSSSTANNDDDGGDNANIIFTEKTKSMSSKGHRKQESNCIAFFCFHMYLSN